MVQNPADILILEGHDKATKANATAWAANPPVLSTPLEGAEVVCNDCA